MGEQFATDNSAPPGTYVGVACPDTYGAFGTGIADDTAALQAAHDALDATLGGTIWLTAGKKYNFTALNITKPNVHIEGPGTLFNGVVNVGVQSGFAPVEMHTRISTRFDRSARGGAGVNAISIANSRIVDVIDCYVNNYSAFVAFPAIAMGSSTQHSARIKIAGTRTPYPGDTGPIDYLLNCTASTTSASPAFAIGDVTVIGNHAVSCDIAHIFGTGIDGLVMVGNTFFFPAYTRANPNKLSHVLVTTADQITIAGNNLFEAGYESINLTSPRSVSITGNTITWSGQRAVKDAIAITLSGAGDYVRGEISGNNFNYFSGKAVAIYGTGGDAQSLTIGPNAVITGNPYTQYYGTGLPSTFTRYYSDSTLTTQPRVFDPYNPFGSANTDAIANTTTEANMRLGIRSNLMSRGKVVTVTAATAVLTLSNAAGSSGTEGGLIILTVADTASGAHLAEYILAVSYSATTQAVTQIAAVGETTGTGASSPSFTWSLNGSNGLVATPVALTSGQFTFYAVAIGNLRVA